MYETVTVHISWKLKEVQASGFTTDIWSSDTLDGTLGIDPFCLKYGAARMISVDVIQASSKLKMIRGCWKRFKANKI